MQRRDMIKVCGGLTGAYLLDQQFGLQFFSPKAYGAQSRVPILGADNKPLLASKLKENISHVFFYPFHGTPAYLLNLGKAIKGKALATSDGTPYNWGGGVGSKQSIVAFTAVCPHYHSYPSRTKSVINFNPHSQVIRCCAHKSEFDVANGGVASQSSPTKAPLASIVLEWDQSTDQIFAVGMIGEESFKPFFKRFKRDLRKQYGSSRKAKTPVDSTVALPISSFTGSQTNC